LIVDIEIVNNRKMNIVNMCVFKLSVKYVQFVIQLNYIKNVFMLR